MQQEAIRDALVSFVYADWATAFPTIPLVPDNAPFDWNVLPDQFVTFEIRWSGGAQVGPAASPKTRLAGHVYVTSYTREGTGSKKALAVNDWFAAKMGYQYVGGAHLQAPEPRDPARVSGFHTEQLAVYFFSDPS